MSDLSSGSANRMSWEEYFAEIATLAAKRSPCNRLKVGCILVKDNRIVATGYNGFLPGAPHKSIIKDNHEIATVHAEQNAICDAAKRGVSIDETEAYIIHYTCLTCFKLLIASGIKHIYYINDYNNDPIVGNMISLLNEPIYSKYASCNDYYSIDKLFVKD